MLASVGRQSLKSSLKHALPNTPLRSIDIEQPLSAALRHMRFHKIGALVITNGGSNCGILTERDVLEKLPFDQDPRKVPVHEIMTTKTVIANQSWSMEMALRTMHLGAHRHLPVSSVDDSANDVFAMLSMRDVAAAVCADTRSIDVSNEATVGQLCAQRARRVIIGTPAPSCIEAPPEASVADAVLLMRQWCAGSVLVSPSGCVSDTFERRSSCGIFTERDYLRLLGTASELGTSLDPRELKLNHCCTPASELIKVQTGTSLLTCLSIMTQAGVRHLPVMERTDDFVNERKLASRDSTIASVLVAVISARDLMAQFLSPHEAGAAWR